MKQTTNPVATTYYVYDAFGNLAAEYGGSPMPCTTCYVSVDQLGSTRAVTNGQGVVVQRHDYMPFGEEIFSGLNGRTAGMYYLSTAASEVGSAMFTGQYRDPELGNTSAMAEGLDFFGARYFSGTQGRFTSPDPGGVGADPGSPQTWNMYSYTGNNPLSAIDPNGLDCVYTSDQTDKSITVTVERGNCSQNTGTFVNGTIDTNALTYNGKSLDLGYTDANGAAGVFSKNLGPAVYEYPGIEGPENRAGAALIGSSQSMINAFAAADAAFAVGYLATYAPAAVGAVRTAQAARAAAQATAALKAAQLALKALPADQYKLLQQWLGPIKAGSPITPPPPGLTPDAMQRYLAVAQAYIAAGGSGAAIQATRIQALNNALGNK